MKRFRLIGAALLAMFALGIVAASSAQAEPAPFFTVGGTRLVAGKTHNFDARARTSFKLKNALGTTVITCTGLGTVGGVLLGSNAGTHGSDNEVVVFTGCILIGNGAACHLAEKEGGETTTVITTNPIKSEQVENVVNGHVGSKLLEEFYPASKGAGFVKLNFGGTGCTLKSTVVAGSTVGESVLDTAAAVTTGGNVELGQTPQERTSWLIRFPNTPITQVWLVSGGLGLIRETGQTAFNEESIQTGVALVLLASTKFEPEPNALWSPLP